MPEPLSNTYDLSQAKTVVPLIANGTLCRLKLVNLTLDKTEKGPSTKWEWEIVEPVPTTDGDQLRPGDFGSKIFENIQMYAKPDAKEPTWFVKKIATRIDGLLGTSDPGNRKGKPARPSIDLNPANADSAIPQLAQAVVGQQIVAKMSVSAFEGVERNEIQKVTFPGDVATS